ncbi:MAG: hypothetical protein JO149_07560 [Gammaproteobacteria bacterium]|nr:hypothetical protein [Gammaproteobacteria bacterium]
MADKIHFHFLLPVWGEEFVKKFIDVSLPILFSLGNLKADERHKNNLFVIMTTYDDSKIIKSSHTYQQLKEIIKIKFILVDGLIDFKNNYLAMTNCYKIGMEQENVIPGKTFFIYLTPDGFYSEGTFDKCFSLAEEGYLVALVLGIRANATTMSALIKEKINTNSTTPIFSKSELIQHIINNISHLSEICNWFTRDGFLNDWPSNIYWIDKENAQLIAHCFHLHPLMIRSPSKKIFVKDTIDGDYLENLKYPLHRHYIFTNEFFGIDLTNPERKIDCQLSTPNIRSVIRFSLKHAYDCHRYYFRHRIELKSDPHRAISSEIEMQARYVSSKVLKNNNKVKLFYYRYFEPTVSLTIQNMMNIARKVKNSFKHT